MKVSIFLQVEQLGPDVDSKDIEALISKLKLDAQSLPVSVDVKLYYTDLNQITEKNIKVVE